MRRERVGGAAVGGWFVAMVVLCGGLLAKHLVALPVPPGDARLGAALSALRSPSEQRAWLAVHVLYSDCRCSGRVAEHLAASPRPRGWSEIVLWVGDEAPSDDLRRRFDVRRVTAGDLAAMGVEAAPMLITLDPVNRVRYAGGYTERKQGPDIDDLRIMEASKSGADIVPGHPLFGCAVSDRLKNEVASVPAP